MRRGTLVDEDGRTVCSDCGRADRPLTRLRGLLGRRGLAPDEGLLIAPTWSVHTWFMTFPIDVVFLDADLRVLAVHARVRPFRLAAHRGSTQVLELPAGAAVRARIAPTCRLFWHAQAAPRT